jgi:hypothetical protein
LNSSEKIACITAPVACENPRSTENITIDVAVMFAPTHATYLPNVHVACEESIEYEENMTMNHQG